ncbi:DUF1320 domain-containing protein [Sphingomonas changnyeongensis]|uniref:DUF1320 domain-containing protein n=1 Tax=Sphingomonas changnyeongensis TaxID=2698679 RepID=A0A7Z2NVQ5_9SPHN|nr:DUF1320 domain-containing protein [Sphingomonas changnyeongensis]QHL90696.1 DUF1320 domain-containing protein [Sphingomonas changnyeongensis]
MIQTVIKQPAEVISQLVPFGAPVTQILAATPVARGMVAGAAALQADAVLVDGSVTVTLAGGTDGERYLVTVRATLATGEEREAEAEIVVIDAAWVMPDGGAPYLSIEDFVRRFGLPEIVRMTDADGSGRIDRDLLVAQLVDAQAIVEAHLAGRYALPLAEVPLPVKKAIADLARASLYPGGAPDGVADAARASMRMLEQIRDGRLTLPSAVPLAAAAIAADPVLFDAGERAYPDGLQDYRL